MPCRPINLYCLPKSDISNQAQRMKLETIRAAEARHSPDLGCHDSYSCIRSGYAPTLKLVGALDDNKVIARPMTVSVNPSGLGKTWCQSSKSLNPTLGLGPDSSAVLCCAALRCAVLIYNWRCSADMHLKRWLCIVVVTRTTKQCLAMLV
jgi:hypothetical protein